MNSVARVVVALLISSTTLNAQGSTERVWNDLRTTALVDRAIARRSAQLADTGLVDYHAKAHGVLTFLAQLGEGYPDPPQIVRADELAVEVYWRAPNQSKQRVVGRRDTLMLPTDINYHRDHLAIVQNDFPAIIRLGEGDEVRDVPHPLSAQGREAYEFATTDSLSIRVGGRSWDVMQIDVRPRDVRQPRVVGSIYLDRATATVVRVSVAFTRAALIDPALEDVSIELDNALVEGRFWLPRRQQIEIRRSGTWLDFPARGIIRGEWDLCCIEPNRGVPASMFAGPEITFAPPSELAAYKFPGVLADTVAARLKVAVDDESARRVQEHAAELVQSAALSRAAGAVLSARKVSDFVRVNRVEGLAIGGALTVGTGAIALRTEGRYGFDDKRLKHDVTLSWQPARWPKFSIGTFDLLRAAGDTPESSTLANSFAAQELGADLTDEYRARGVSLAVQGGTRFGWRLSAERTNESPVAVHATPASGTYRPAFGAVAVASSRLQWEGAASRVDGPVGTTWDVAAALGISSDDARDSISARTYARGRLRLSVEHPMPGGLLVVSTVAASVFGAQVPEQQRVLFGGPQTAPGYDTHSIRGTSGATTRAEWRIRVGSFPVNLGRFGVTRVPVIVAPLFQAAGVAEDVASGVHDSSSWYRSLGLGIISFHDLLRLDVVKGLDRGGAWSVRLDFGRMFWPIL